MNTSAAGQFLDVFTTEELLSTQTALQKLKDSPNQGSNFHAYTNGFVTTDLIYPFFKKIILSKLESKLGRELKLTHGMYLKEQRPWGIHTDYIKEDQVPDLALLIPLNILDLPTHTVMFDQMCCDSFEQYVKNHEPVENNAINLQHTLMSHETTERLKYVSLQGAYQWISGSVIYWDRKLLHSSDNFVNSGLLEKHALVLFTNHD
jgi:hypothetical protein